MATADGSLRTTPRPGAEIRVLTVPRSIARSSVKILLRMFIASPTWSTASLLDILRRGQLRLGKWRSTKTDSDKGRISKNGSRGGVSFPDEPPRRNPTRRAGVGRKRNDEPRTTDAEPAELYVRCRTVRRSE